MRRGTITSIAAAALLLAACGSTADDENGAAAPDQAPGEEQAPGPDEAEGDGAPPQDPFEGLADLQEMVEDETFRGEGIVLPVPEGWQFEPVAQLQGQVLVSEGPEGLEQIAGQAVDVEALPETLTFEELLDSNRQQFQQEPEIDEPIEIEGAEQARHLRYEALPAGQEELPEVSIVLIVAEDGDGRLASFNYAAATDEFDESLAERLLSTAGFDPDSDPTPPGLPALEGEPQG